MKQEKSFDIARSIRAIEGLKVDLLSSVTELFRSLQGGSYGDLLVETLSHVMFCAWRLAEKLGIPMEQVNARLAGKIGMLEAGEPEALIPEFKGVFR